MTMLEFYLKSHIGEIAESKFNYSSAKGDAQLGSELVVEFLTSPDMLLNLTSEAIGLIAGAILFTGIGQWLARKSASRKFDNRWNQYRKNLATALRKNSEDLQRLLWLANIIERVSAIELDNLDRSYLDEFRIEKSKLAKTFDELESVISNHHFALRSRDIEVGQDFVTAIAKAHERSIGLSELNIQNFESQLLNFLNDPKLAADRLPPQFFDGTRFDHWRASGMAAVEILRKVYTDIAASPASSTNLQLTLEK